MKMQILGALILGATLVAGTGPAAAAPDAGSPEEDFRNQLDRFLERAEALEDRGRINGADAGRLRGVLETASPDDYAQLEQDLAGVEGWASVPDMMGTAFEAGEIQTRMEAALDELRAIRHSLQSLDGAGNLDPDEATVYLDRMDLLEEQVRAAASGFSQLPGAPAKAQAMALAAAGGCGDKYDCRHCSGKPRICVWDPICLIGKIDCLEPILSGLINDVKNFVTSVTGDIGRILGEIAALPGRAWTQLEALVTSLFNQFLDLVPSDVDEFLEAMGMDDSDWYEDVLLAASDLSPFDPALDPPCPEMGDTVPGIGEVGSIRAEWTCRRGIDWFAAMLYDVAPDDVFDIPVKLVATGLYYPINYLCLCMEAQSEISFDDAQREHRELVAERLNEDVWTRATQLSVDRLNADLGMAQAELDAVAGQVASVDGQADVLHVLQDEQDRLLDQLRALSNRMAIEGNLLADRPDTIASFQVPDSAGGYLERVREILAQTIQMNLDAGEEVNNAFRELERGDAALASGAWEQAYTHYQQAYREAVRN